MDPFRRSTPIEHLVVDAGGFIKYVEIQSLGQVIYSLPEVVSEIKDKNTRERLAVLPFALNFVNPPPDAIKTVSEFAKKTGDFSNLSTTDIKVIALTLLLHKEHEGAQTIRQEPTKRKIVKYNPVTAGNSNGLKQAFMPGFFLPQNDEDACSGALSRKGPSSRDSVSSVLYGSPTDFSKDEESLSLSHAESTVEENVIPGSETAEEAISSRFDTMNLSVSEDDYESEDEEQTSVYAQEVASAVEEQENGVIEANNTGDDDEAGWITPSNIAKVYQKMGIRSNRSAMVSHKVACLTTDFSVQNVLMQMGIHVVAADGMLIKTLRTYVLRCFGCYRVTHDTSKRFCPACGNSTLKRVCMTLDKNGQPKYHISTKRPLNTRGTKAMAVKTNGLHVASTIISEIRPTPHSESIETGLCMRQRKMSSPMLQSSPASKFSLPMPKGGKHAVNPILSEDQPVPHFCAPKKSLQALNVFDPDYVARDSPFLINDLTSRASLLGRRGQNKFSGSQPWMSKNPNAVRRPRK